ncbi:MAG: hypothetical protein KBT34_11010, partial [Prevotella sp.]|nr:hypothetical protein [Candidatus Prevotella equi]
TIINFTVGDDIVTVISSGDNMSDVDSDEFTVTAPTQVVWPAEGNAEHCLDAIIVYQYDAEVAADTVVADVNADVETIKVIENNQLVIKTAKGCFNVAGMQVK